jgi:hypothetical protein
VIAKGTQNRPVSRMNPKAGGVQLVRVFFSQHVLGVKAEAGEKRGERI